MRRAGKMGLIVMGGLIALVIVGQTLSRWRLESFRRASAAAGPRIARVADVIDTPETSGSSAADARYSEGIERADRTGEDPIAPLLDRMTAGGPSWVRTRDHPVMSRLL